MDQASSSHEPIQITGKRSNAILISEEDWRAVDEKLVGDLGGAYSRRINLQHRLVYQVYKKSKVIKVIRMWTHYE